MLMIYLAMVDTDEERFKIERIYNTYYGLMMNVAYDYMDNKSDCEDAVHQSFLKIINKISIIDENNGHKLKAFIVVIIRNVCLDILRKQKRTKIISIDELNDNLYCDENLTDEIIEKIEIQDLKNFIFTLKPIYRDILILKLVNTCSDKEISLILNISEIAVRKRYQRAKSCISKSFQMKG